MARSTSPSVALCTFVLLTLLPPSLVSCQQSSSVSEPNANDTTDAKPEDATSTSDTNTPKARGEMMDNGETIDTANNPAAPATPENDQNGPDGAPSPSTDAENQGKPAAGSGGTASDGETTDGGETANNGDARVDAGAEANGSGGSSEVTAGADASAGGAKETADGGASAAQCPNGWCEAQESPQSCPADCGEPCPAEPIFGEPCSTLGRQCWYQDCSSYGGLSMQCDEAVEGTLAWRYVLGGECTGGCNEGHTYPGDECIASTCEPGVVDCQCFADTLPNVCSECRFGESFGADIYLFCE